MSADIQSLDDAGFRKLLSDTLRRQRDDRKENQLLYYQPVSEKARQFHACGANTVGIFGGNGSSKTETALVDMLISATGVVPLSLRGVIHPSKLRGPVACRVVCRSLSNMLHTTMLPKVQWWRWDGESEPDGPRGHWGWIPKLSLVGGKWDDSWSEKNRILRVHYRDPQDSSRIMGESTIQWMSSDQDALDMAASSLHVVVVDELSSHAVWKENKARVMRGNGRITVSMTWPDDPAIPCEWVFDEVYDPGQPGPTKDKDTEVFEFHTVENKNLNQERVLTDMNKMSESDRKVRIFGQALRFSNRIHPLFTDVNSGWCFKCQGETVLKAERCLTCDSANVTTYCHVKEFDHHRGWPVICVIDPHPRKPHMLSWIAVDGYDDLWQIAELKVDADPVTVKQKVDEIERLYGMNVAIRIMDPRMGENPADAKNREATWQSEFRDAGLLFDLADSSSVGRDRVNYYLRPDPRRLQPRMHIHSRCQSAIFQFKRFCWSEYKEAREMDLKQKPQEKNDDFPAMWRYCLNLDPSFMNLTRGVQAVAWTGR